MIENEKISRETASKVYSGLTNLIFDKSTENRNKSDDLLEKLFSIKILDFINFNDKNYIFMQRLMKLNIFEHDITLNALGIGDGGDRNEAAFRGDSDSFNSLKETPSYAEERDYVKNFVNDAKSKEISGGLSTRETFVNDVYFKTENLYPDELDIGEFNNKWRDVETNRNSILNKTKKLFSNRNINTIISRFGTGADETNEIKYNGSIRTKYGESRGRNLLKRDAEKGGDISKYEENGYNNPYCRVWTHHYQYDKLSKTIRTGSSGASANSVHDWNKTFRKNEDNTDYKGGYWKDGNRGWDNSVLKENGLINITPKYSKNGTNIHTKDCMFSIENLAWKDYNPYTFENALSWEQRGPNGGRIMWFPPYGINFSESTNTNWSSNTFIGRGEDVYTYVNTNRTGSLSFLMVIDHPSVVDYSLWYKDNKDSDVTDNDLLRFFAGCDSMNNYSDDDNYSLISKVKPTPLTDELSTNNYRDIYKNVKKNNFFIENSDENINKGEIEIAFPIYFPNNYSGSYDYPINKNSNVDSIAYLLGGHGVQKQEIIKDVNGNTKREVEDKPIRFSDMHELRGGYELDKPLSNKREQDIKADYIIGSLKKFNQYEYGEKYEQDWDKIWYYRIDGEYKVPFSKLGVLTNTYDQTYRGENNIDKKCYGLNKDIQVSKDSNNLSNYTKDGEAYSFLDVAAALAYTSGFIKTYENLKKISKDNNAIEKLKFLLEHYLIKNCEINGYASVHGNKEKNKQLAKYRSITVKEWLKECGSYNQSNWDKVINEATFNNLNSDYDNYQESNSNKSASDVKIKMDRVVIVKLSFSIDSKNLLAESNQSNNKLNVFEEYIGYTYLGENIYQDNKGQKWEKIKDIDDETTRFRLLLFDNADEKDYNELTDRNKYEYLKNNTYRYDQEYHFFKKLEKDAPLVYDSLMDKLKYFDPAFHSMTPEGFNGRLTFLQQCMRQGNTKTMSDLTSQNSDNINGHTGNNLAFGRPPFCILRLGDFYNQMIVIDSLNIDYNVSNGVQWDFNIEGAGVQPLLANVTINFKFIGGGDLTGPIKRLQNAMSFNYYANARLYDNRADRYEYNINNVGLHGDLKDTSYSYKAEMNKIK